MITIDEQILREGLLELSDERLQFELWVNGTPNRMSLYGEALCYVFDDSNVSRAMDKGQLEEIYGDDFVKKMKKLSSLNWRIQNLDLTTVELIEHPKMKEIREVSADLLRMLEK